MNIKKIESDFLKGLFSKESNKYIMGEYESCVAYCDGFYIALVPKNDAYVRCERQPFNVETVITDMFNHRTSTYSYTITNTHSGNIARYDRVDGKGYAYIDVKYTKYFDKDAHYSVKDFKSLVHVYENDQLVGVICPVRINE